MIGWYSPTTATTGTEPWLQWGFVDDCTATTMTVYTGDPNSNGWDPRISWWDCPSSPVRLKPLTRKELAQLRAKEREPMFPRRIERAPAPCEAVNAGMHIRRMRASTGLARGRA